MKMKRLVSWLLALILAGGLLACNNGCGATDPVVINYNITQPIKQHSQVEVLKKYNVIVHRERKAVCGGTIIFSDKNKTQVLTATHCIMDDLQVPMSYGLINVGDGELYRVKVVRFHRAQDLALLETTDKIKPQKTAPIARLAPVFGDEVWAIGYGAAVEDAVSKGIVSKTDSTGHMGTHVMQLDITGWYGNSGGGIYNKDFELVGVMIEFGPQGGRMSGWMYATHLVEIIKFLNGE